MTVGALPRSIVALCGWVAITGFAHGGSESPAVALFVVPQLFVAATQKLAGAVIGPTMTMLSKPA